MELERGGYSRTMLATCKMDTGISLVLTRAAENTPPTVRRLYPKWQRMRMSHSLNMRVATYPVYTITTIQFMRNILNPPG